MGRRERKPGPADGALHDEGREERIALLEGVYEEHRHAPCDYRARMLPQKLSRHPRLSPSGSGPHSVGAGIGRPPPKSTPKR